MSSKNTFNIKARLSQVSSLSSNIKYEESKVPEPALNYASQFKAAASPRVDSSNTFIIDTFPDFIPIICMIIFHANYYAHSIDSTNHAKASVPTFVAYCLSICYGYFLLSDMYVRPTPSAAAQEWKNSSYREDFAKFLASLPVPDFLSDFLRAFPVVADETRSNVLFVPSAAGFRYKRFFGRFFPVIAFTNLHDVTAEMPSNTPRHDILNETYGRILYSITAMYNGSPAFHASLGNFIGFGYTTTGTNRNGHSASRLYQAFESVFNSVLFRDYQRRHTLAAINLVPKTYPTSYMNVYDLLFSADANNLSELRVVFTSISALFKGNIKSDGDLASFFDNQSGLSILRHGYSELQLPTFHHTQLIADSDSGLEHPLTATLRPRPRTPAQVATEIGFLVPGNLALSITHEQPAATCDTDRAHPVTLTHTGWPFNLLLAARNPRTAPDTDSVTQVPHPTNDFIQFDEEHHVYPRVRVLSPADESTVDAWMATAFGMVIQSFEIDGSVVPHPDATLSLGTENTWFADSAISLEFVFRSTFLAKDNAAPVRARKRVHRPRQQAMPAALLFVDRTKINLPQIAPETGTNISGNTLPGMTIVPSVTWIQKAKSFLGFTTAYPLSPNENTFPGYDSADIYVWSPYTYTSVSPQQDGPVAHNEQRTYFLTNLRTIYGTRHRLIELENGLKCVPIA